MLLSGLCRREGGYCETRMSSTPNGGFVWIWCSRCSRCYHVGNARRTDTLRMCAYEDCDGHLALDGLPWEIIHRRHPHFPDVPEVNVSYTGVRIIDGCDNSQPGGEPVAGGSDNGNVESPVGEGDETNAAGTGISQDRKASAPPV